MERNAKHLNGSEIQNEVEIKGLNCKDKIWWYKHFHDKSYRSS